MDKIAAKKQILILVGVLILILVVFFLLVWKPQGERIEDLGNQQNSEEIKLQSAKTMLTVLEEKKKDAVGVEAEVLKISKQMPTDAELPDLIDQLQDLANNAGVKLISIRPGTLVSRGEFSELQVDIVVEGSYVCLIDFLARVERAQRVFKTSAIDIKVKQYPDLTLNASLSAFVMGSEGVPPAASAKGASSGQTTSKVATVGQNTTVGQSATVTR